MESIYNYSVNVSVSSGGKVSGQGTFEKESNHHIDRYTRCWLQVCWLDYDDVTCDPNLPISVSSMKFNVSANFEELDATDYLDLFD